MCMPLGPIDDDWVAPDGTGHKFLLKYMLAEQQLMFGETILKQFNYSTLIRNMKLLCQNYTDDAIKRGIALAIQVCEYPFSTKQIGDCIQWRRDLLSCEVLESYRNKS